MSKIICDICGTTYPDTADCCPICGCSRDSAMDFLGESFQMEEPAPEVKKGKFASKNRKEIFDFDEVNADTDETQILDEEPEDDEVYQERPKTSIGAIIGLTILIALLLLFAAFLGLRYILPNLNGGAAETTAPAADTEYLAEPTSHLVPCQKLAMLSGAAQLSQEGQYFLINVIATPEDTTDVITYTSGDESIATVSEDGKITAVSEGETVVYITCGNVQVTCPVTVKFEEETLPPTEAETEPVTEPATEAATEPTQSGLKDVTLKLKKTDIMLTVGYGFRLELACDLDPSEVEWSVEHDHIASVDDTGLVMAKKFGTTSVTAKYGDQEVKCMVRCG